MGIPPGRFRLPLDLGQITDVTLRSKVADLQTDRDQLATRLQQLEPLEREVQTVRGEADAVKIQNATLASNNADLQAQVARHVADIGAKESELTTLRTGIAQGRRVAVERDQLKIRTNELSEAVKQRDAAIAKHLAEIADLSANPPTPAAGGTLLPIASVATNVAEQISTAQTAIRAAGGFTLGNVSVRLKGVAEGDAGKIRILGASELRNPNLAGALDELNMDFTAPTAPAPVPAD